MAKKGKNGPISPASELLKKTKICRSLSSLIHAVETKSNSFQGSLNRTIYLCAFSHKSSLQLVLTIKSRRAWSVNLLFGETFPESAEKLKIMNNGQLLCQSVIWKSSEFQIGRFWILAKCCDGVVHCFSTRALWEVMMG